MSNYSNKNRWEAGFKEKWAARNNNTRYIEDNGVHIPSLVKLLWMMKIIIFALGLWSHWSLFIVCGLSVVPNWLNITRVRRFAN